MRRQYEHITNDVEKEWQTLKDIVSDFFIPVASNSAFNAKASKWIANSGAHPWDTSVMKVIDNLLIGSRKWILSGSDPIESAQFFFANLPLGVGDQVLFTN